eukprot:1733517-Amphidinium_carterae.1
MEVDHTLRVRFFTSSVHCHSCLAQFLPFRLAMMATNLVPVTICPVDCYVWSWQNPCASCNHEDDS